MKQRSLHRVGRSPQHSEARKNCAKPILLPCSAPTQAYHHIRLHRPPALPPLESSCAAVSCRRCRRRRGRAAGSAAAAPPWPPPPSRAPAARPAPPCGEAGPTQSTRLLVWCAAKGLRGVAHGAQPAACVAAMARQPCAAGGMLLQSPHLAAALISSSSSSCTPGQQGTSRRSRVTPMQQNCARA